MIDLCSAKIRKYSKELYNVRLRLQLKYKKKVSKRNTILKKILKNYGMLYSKLKK